MLKAGLETVKPGKWLTGYQISAFSLKENRLPTRHDLDKVSDKVPIFLSSSCLHSFMLNSRGLALSGITQNFSGPERRLLDFDGFGELTGRLKEHGLLKTVNAVKPPLLETLSEQMAALHDALLDFSRSGFTTVHSYDGFDGSETDGFKVYQELRRAGRLPMRVVLNKQNGVNNALGAISGFGDEFIKYGSVKLLTDGCFSQHSAFLLESYADMDGFYGIPLYKDDEYLALVKRAYDAGNDVAIHVIGDGGMAQVLSLIEKVYDPKRKQQFRLIHGSLTTPGQWETLAKYPVTVDMQPVFIPSMGTTGRERLGRIREKYLLPMKSMLDHGICVTGGDDAPIATHNPFVGIRYAVLREIELDGEVLNPSECLSVYEAASLYTRNAAHCAHEEDIKGTVEVGKLADFIVLDRDIFEIPKKEISQTKVLKTYLGGKAVY